jgi:hypothetical protein
VDTIVNRHGDIDGYRVRLTGRWADVELLHPEHPYGGGWPPPGRWFVIEGIERQERVEDHGEFSVDYHPGE